MKALLKILPLIGLVACASPAANMSQFEISSLSNNQLCALKNNYPWEQKTEVEVGRRNLNCDPVYNACLMKGIEANSPAMGMCVENYYQQAAMQQQINVQQSQLQMQNSSQRLQQAADNAAHHNWMMQQQRQRANYNRY